MVAKESLSSISHLADLARLDFGPEERKKREREFREIVEYVDKIGSVEATARSLATTISGVAHVLRDDHASESALADALLEAVPERRRRFIRVPVIL